MSLWCLRFIEEFTKLRVWRHFVLVMFEEVILHNTGIFRIQRLSDQRLMCRKVMMSRWWDNRLFFILLSDSSCLRSTCEGRLETYVSTAHKNRLLNDRHMIKISVGFGLIIWRFTSSYSSFCCWIRTFIYTKAALLGFLLIFPWPFNE